MNIKISSTDNSNIQFQGLTKQLSHHIFVDGKKDIGLILEKKKPQNTYVGTLPPVIFYALSKANREQNIKDIYHTFNEVSDEIRQFKPSIRGLADEYKNKRPQTAVNKLKQMFIRIGLLKEDDKFDITYLGAGEYKKSYKLEGIVDPKSGEEVSYKIFHKVDITPEWHKYKSHGNFAELNISSYWKKHLGLNTQRGKFYYGNIGHGYFLDKFIDKKVNPPKIEVNEYDEGIKLTDEVKSDFGHNKIFGYSIDPGGVRVVNRVKNESRTAKHILKRLKMTPKRYRELEWHRLNNNRYDYDKRQKEAGLALCIKHLPHKEKYVEECLKYNNNFADMGISYALKYLPEESAFKYFEILLKRNDPTTQEVLLNEIPLLSRERIGQQNMDDLDVPRGEINTEKLSKYYYLAKNLILPEAEEHLASYVHLLPKDQIIPEAKDLIEKNNYHINDRLLHKIKFVKEEEYSFSDKMTIINMLEKKEHNDFLTEKIKTVKTLIIRNSLGD